MFFIMRLFSWI